MTRSGGGGGGGGDDSFQKHFAASRDSSSKPTPWVLADGSSLDDCQFPGLGYLCFGSATDCCCLVAPFICGIGVQLHVDDEARTIRFRQWSGYNCCLCCQETVTYDDIVGVTTSFQSTHNTILGTTKGSSAEKCMSFAGRKPQPYAVHLMTKDGRKIDLANSFGSKEGAAAYGKEVHSFLFGRGKAATSYTPPEHLELISSDVHGHFETCMPLCCFTVPTSWPCPAWNPALVGCLNSSKGGQNMGGGGRGNGMGGRGGGIGNGMGGRGGIGGMGGRGGMGGGLL